MREKLLEIIHGVSGGAFTRPAHKTLDMVLDVVQRELERVWDEGYHAHVHDLNPYRGEGGGA
jgi:hypothetical protein